MFRLLYPGDHPYHWPIIGWMDHLDAMTLDDVCSFFRRYYTPAQATLVLSGSFDRSQALGWIEKYFGPIPASGRQPTVAGDAPPLAGDALRVMDEGVSLARWDIVWPTVPRFAEEEAALDVASLILSEGKDSHLRRRLERDQELVHSVDAYHSTLHLAGQFGIWAYALPDTDVDRLNEEIRASVDAFLREPPSQEELVRARRWFANRAYSRMETVLGKAETIQHYHFHLGRVEPDCLSRELDRYDKLTAEDVHQAAKKYLAGPTLSILVRPGEPDDRESSPRGKETGSSTKHRMGANPALIPAPGRNPTFRLPRAERRRVGSLPILIWQKNIPRVSMQLVLDAGSAWDRNDQLGVARLVCDCLEEGTATRDALEIARRLEILGASVSASSGIESATLSLRALRSTLVESMELFADMLTHPRFAAEDVDRERDRLAAELIHHQKQPRSLADDAIDEILFGGEHAYGRPADGKLDHLPSITNQELSSFHRERFRPGSATLIIVGDIEPAEAEELVADKLGAFISLAPSVDRARIDAPSPPSDRLRIIARDESTQSILRLGGPGPRRVTEDYETLILLNTILGGQFSSRLNVRLREERGFTYGVSSSFVCRRQGGSFLAGTDVDGRVTREAIESLIDVVLGPGGSVPITQQELDFAKAYIIRRFPARFETAGSIVGQLAHLVVYELPDDTYEGYLGRIAAVTVEKIREAACRYLDPRQLKAIIVGRPEDTAGMDESILSR
jgi:zinc protease